MYTIKKSTIKRVNEALQNHYTGCKKSLDEIIHDLSNAIGCTIYKDDKGNFNIVHPGAHKFSIRPIAGDIFDLEYFRDNSDRKKFLYITSDELKNIVKRLCNDEDASLNYVDSAYQKCSNNTDPLIGKYTNNLKVNLDGTPKETPATDLLNDDEDNPDSPMHIVDTFKKMSDYPETMVKSKYPKLPKELNKLIIKYSKK